MICEVRTETHSTGDFSSSSRDLSAAFCCSSARPSMEFIASADDASFREEGAVIGGAGRDEIGVFAGGGVGGGLVFRFTADVGDEDGHLTALDDGDAVEVHVENQRVDVIGARVEQVELGTALTARREEGGGILEVL